MSKYKILLIDDDKLIRENTAEILTFANYHVVTASDGKEGLKTARIEKPDIIVCDIMMPKLDGYGVYHIISHDTELQNTPFIFMSSKGSRDDIRKGMGLGVDDYITKPFEEYELLKSIETRISKNKKNKEVYHFKVTGEKFKTLEEFVLFLIDRDTHQYRKGETIYCEGNYSNCMYLLKKGVVKLHKMSEEGKELITGFSFSHQFFGYTSLMANSEHTENATAMEDIKLVKVDREEIKRLLESNPHLTLEFLELIAKEYKESKDRLLHMAYDSVRGRIAKTLLMLSEINTHIFLSRADLANLTGIAKETLIRTLSEFKESGLIETSSKSYKVLKKKELEKIQ
jgi:CRP-like cAMP-binding protein/CheY-like chemotaxis protein